MKKAIRYVIIGVCILIGFYGVLKNVVAPFFVHRHNASVLNQIKAIDRKSYIVFVALANDVERETNWHIVLTSGYRTEDEQGALNDTDDRNAVAGHSKHNFGKAIDVNFYKNGWLRGIWLMKASDKKRWEDSGVLKIAQKHRLKWGGNFKRYYDPVHFEVE